jgi:hypothetical protein
VHVGQVVIVFGDVFRVDAAQDLTAEAGKHGHLPIGRTDRGEKAFFAKPPPNRLPLKSAPPAFPARPTQSTSGHER